MRIIGPVSLCTAQGADGDEHCSPRKLDFKP